MAMSGVRAHDPALTALGLTLPGFVERNKVIASLPSLGLITLAALTPEHHDISYYEIEDYREGGRLPQSLDIVALSTFSAQVFEAYKVAERFRSMGTQVVMGGLHVSVCPDEALLHCDSVVIGEGEPLWGEVLRDCEKGSLKQVYRTALPFDLADAPIPRFDLLDANRYNRLTVQTSRGCPWRCDFCASSYLIAPKYKTKPVEKVVEEIRAIKRIWNNPFIELADDNSFVDRAYSRRLLKALALERIRWFTETDISIGEDPELLDLLAESGCQQVLIGLESPRRKSLEGVEMQANWKAGKVKGYKRSIQAIQSRGITVNGCFVLGLDGDSPEVFEDVLRFSRESSLYEVQVTVLTPFPGTPLYARLKKERRILREGAWDRCTLFDLNFKPLGMTESFFRRQFVNLVRLLYSKEETEKRRRRYRKMRVEETRRAQ